MTLHEENSQGPAWQSDLECVSRNLGWNMDMASFWTEICGGVQTEESGQSAFVGQCDSPWNCLAHHVWPKVNELAVNLQLDIGYNHI